MPKMHFREHGFSYHHCVPFTENKEKIQKFKETGFKIYLSKRSR